MAAALIPAALGAAGSSGALAGLVSAAAPTVIEKAKSIGGGLMSGIGNFVTGLLRGKGFKESLASGIETTLGMPQSGDSQSAGTLKNLQEGDGLAISGGLAPGRMGGITHIRGGFSDSGTYYVVAVIPLEKLRTLVMLYMSRKGYTKDVMDRISSMLTREAIHEADPDVKAALYTHPSAEDVPNMKSNYTYNVPVEASPPGMAGASPMGRTYGGMNIKSENQNNYGWPIFAPGPVLAPSNQMLYPKYQLPSPIQTNPGVTQSQSMPTQMASGGIPNKPGSGGVMSQPSMPGQKAEPAR
jgi:hypothetical protein